MKLKLLILKIELLNSKKYSNYILKMNSKKLKKTEITEIKKNFNFFVIRFGILFELFLNK